MGWLDGRMGDRITGREAIGCGGNCEEKRRERAQSTQAELQQCQQQPVAAPEEQAGKLC